MATTPETACDNNRGKCIFCYQSLAKAVKNNKFMKTVKRFFVAVERFASFSRKSRIKGLLTDNLSGQLRVCAECVPLMENFLEEYHQWKSLELRLEWRIDLLLLKLKSRKPARGNENDPISKFRCEIIQQCLQRHRISQPRVKLRKIQISQKRKNDPSSEHAFNPNSCVTSILPASQWLLALAVVHFLRTSKSSKLEARNEHPKTILDVEHDRVFGDSEHSNNTSIIRQKPQIASVLSDQNDHPAPASLQIPKHTDILIDLIPAKVSLLKSDDDEQVFAESIKLEDIVSEEPSSPAPQTTLEQPTVANIANSDDIQLEKKQSHQNTENEHDDVLHLGTFDDDDYSSETSSDSEMEDNSNENFANTSSLRSSYSEAGSMLSLQNQSYDLCTFEQHDKEFKNSDLNASQLAEDATICKNDFTNGTNNANVSHTIEITFNKLQQAIGKYTCQFCSHTFSNVVGLASHERGIHGQVDHDAPQVTQDYRCPRCDFACADNKEYTVHFAKEHLSTSDILLPEMTPQENENLSNPDSKFQEEENVCTDLTENFKDNINDDNISATFSDSTCPKSTDPNFEKRIKARRRLNCQFCNYGLLSILALANHERSTHSSAATSAAKNVDKTIFRCPRCTYTGQTNENYLKHFTSTHVICDPEQKTDFTSKDCKDKTKPWICKICTKSCRSEGSLWRHMQEHTGKNVVDDHSSATSSESETENSPKETSEDKPANNLNAEKTVAAPKLTSKIPRHILVRDKSLICKICSEPFRSLAILLRHLRDTHNTGLKFAKQKMNQCNSCQRSNFTQAQYAQHFGKCRKRRRSRFFSMKLAGNKRRKTLVKDSNARVKPEKSNICPESQEMSQTTVLENDPKSHFETSEQETSVNPRYSLRAKRRKVYTEEMDEEDETLNNDPEYPMNHENPSTSSESEENFSSDEEKSDVVDPNTSQNIPHAKCSICHKKFVRRSSSKLHFNTYHNIKGMDPAQVRHCDEPDCGAYFRKLYQKQCHMAKFHNAQQKQAVGNETKLGSDGKKKFVCKICNKSYPLLGHLLRHNRIYHRQNADPSKPLRYNYKNTRKDLYVCPEVKCISQYTSKEHLENHQKLHGSFQCQFCAVTVDFAPDLGIHELEHVPNVENPDTKKGFPCSRCSSKFQQEYALKRHFCSVHLGLNYGALRCPICEFPLREEKTGQTKNAKLRHHLQNAHGVKNAEDPPPKESVQCDLCPAFFKTISQMNVHKLRGHWKSRCPVCPNYKPWRNVDDQTLQLRKHMAKYHPNLIETNLPFACTMLKCSARFLTQKQLDSHIQKHATEIKFQCSHCGKQLANAQTLKKHEVGVHGEAKFVCQDCGKAFPSKDRLKVHYTYNHKPREERKYKCDKCDKRFADSAKLADHQWAHTKEKSFVCQFCGEKYAYRHTWKRHVQIKHPQEFKNLGK